MDGLSNNLVNFPLVKLRQRLLATDSLLPSGRSNPDSSFKDLAPLPFDNRKIECLLNSTIKLSETGEARIIDFVTKYLETYPEHDIHLAGSSLPADIDWFKKIISQKAVPEKCKLFLENCVDNIALHFSDIDLRIIISSAESQVFHKILCDLANERVPNKTPYEINVLTHVYTFEGTPYDLDIITYQGAEPSHLTTTDSLYISLKDWIKTKNAIPKLAKRASFPEWFLHRLTKIFYIDQPINHGALKRLVQFQSCGWATPQAGIVKKTVKIFLTKKPSVKQFVSCFTERQAHLHSSKSKLAFCLNIIGMIDDYFEEGDKFNYWQTSPKFISNKFKNQLLIEVTEYIKKYSYGCGYLVTTIKMCSLLMLEGNRAFNLKDALPVFPSCQNGENFLALSLDQSQNAVVQLKYEPAATVEKFIHIFRPEYDADDIKPRLALLSGILLKFILYVLSKGKKATKHDISFPIEVFNSLTPDDKPILHFISLFLKIINGSPFESIESLTSSLIFLETEDKQRLLLNHLPPQKLVKKFLKVLDDNGGLSFTSIQQILILHYCETSVEKAYQQWKEAADSKEFDEEVKCYLLSLLLKKTQAQSLGKKRLFYPLEKDKVDPLILTNHLSADYQLMVAKHCLESNNLIIAADILLKVGTESKEAAKELSIIFSDLLSHDINKAWEAAALFLPLSSKGTIKNCFNQLITKSQKNSASLNLKLIDQLLPDLSVPMKKLSPNQIGQNLMRLSKLNIHPLDSDLWLFAIDVNVKTALGLINAGQKVLGEDIIPRLKQIGLHSEDKDLSVLRSVIEWLEKLESPASRNLDNCKKKKLKRS